MPVTVTDHALVRWLERSHGIDMEGYRRMLASQVEPIAKLGAASVPIEGLWYVFDNGRLVTVRQSKPLRHARHDRENRNGSTPENRDKPNWRSMARKRRHK